MWSGYQSVSLNIQKYKKKQQQQQQINKITGEIGEKENTYVST